MKRISRALVRLSVASLWRHYSGNGEISERYRAIEVDSASSAQTTADSSPAGRMNNEEARSLDLPKHGSNRLLTDSGLSRSGRLNQRAKYDHYCMEIVTYSDFHRYRELFGGSSIFK